MVHIEQCYGTSWFHDSHSIRKLYNLSIYKYFLLLISIKSSLEVWIQLTFVVFLTLCLFRVGLGRRPEDPESSDLFPSAVQMRRHAILMTVNHSNCKDKSTQETKKQSAITKIYTYLNRIPSWVRYG